MWGQPGGRRARSSPLSPTFVPFGDSARPPPAPCGVQIRPQNPSSGPGGVTDPGDNARGGLGTNPGICPLPGTPKRGGETEARRPPVPPVRGGGDPAPYTAGIWDQGMEEMGLSPLCVSPPPKSAVTSRPRWGQRGQRGWRGRRGQPAQVLRNPFILLFFPFKHWVCRGKIRLCPHQRGN